MDVLDIKDGAAHVYDEISGLRHLIGLLVEKIQFCAELTDEIEVKYFNTEKCCKTLAEATEGL